MIRWALLVCLFFFTKSTVWSQAATKSNTYSQSCAVENQAFETGEELIYKIYYNLNFIWIPAGEVHFRIKSDDHHYHILATGYTYDSYEWFYEVDDVYETVLDKKTLLPLRANRRISEGGYRLYERVTFDQEEGTAHVVRGRDKASATDRGFTKLSHCSADLVSLFFRLRNVDKAAFKRSGKMPINFFLDEQEYNIDMHYLGDMSKRIKGMGRFDVIKVSPNLIAGKVFNEGDQLMAWVSDDDNRVPLMIESPLSVGSAKAVLKSYRGLKYPLGGS